MIIYTHRVFKGFDAFTVWPFIFVRPEARNDTGLIEHEMVHYREQRSCLTVPWLIAYFISKRFRLDAEVRAYKRHIEVGGITTDHAAEALTKYGLSVTVDQARKLLA